MSAAAPSSVLDLGDRGSRLVWACIAVSLLLHALVLFLAPSMREGKPAGAPSIVLTARLTSRSLPAQPEFRPEVRPEVRPDPRPVSPPPRTEAPRPMLTAPAPGAAPSSPRPQEAPVAPPPAASAAPATAAPVAPPPAAPQAPSAPPVAALSRPADAAPSPGPAEAVDTGTLDRFRMEILAATRRYRRYPAQAIEKGWQGKVEIRLVIGANGMTQSYAIKSSSGFQLLDDTAMDMVKKGRPLVQVPASLRGREFTVDVPVIFDLKSG